MGFNYPYVLIMHNKKQKTPSDIKALQYFKCILGIIVFVLFILILLYIFSYNN
jgi:Na+/H+ antiporter NhaD/arsenite permease-like protein